MKRKSYQKVKGLTGVLAMTMALGLTAGEAGATNGMNLEGYGPEALAMGGAAFAYDNGTAGVMNNPATLGLMNQGHRFDLALGFLSPIVTTKQAGETDADSASDLFLMPARLGQQEEQAHLWPGRLRPGRHGNRIRRNLLPGQGHGRCGPLRGRGWPGHDPGHL